MKQLFFASLMIAILAFCYSKCAKAREQHSVQTTPLTELPSLKNLPNDSGNAAGNFSNIPLPERTETQKGVTKITKAPTEKTFSKTTGDFKVKKTERTLQTKATTEAITPVVYANANEKKVAAKKKFKGIQGTSKGQNRLKTQKEDPTGGFFILRPEGAPAHRDAKQAEFTSPPKKAGKLEFLGVEKTEADKPTLSVEAKNLGRVKNN